MANNPYVNKVQINGEAVIDLTGDTVTPATLLSGATAHDRSGAPITGTATSDATATANNVEKDKTAYVNGQKITGTLEKAALIDTSPTASGTTVSDISALNALVIGCYPKQSGFKQIADTSTKITAQASYSKVRSAIGLTADKIVEGNTILGIAGTAASNTEAPIIHLYGEVCGALFSPDDSDLVIVQIETVFEDGVYIYVPVMFENGMPMLPEQYYYDAYFVPTNLPDALRDFPISFPVSFVITNSFIEIRDSEGTLISTTNQECFKVNLSALNSLVTTLP